MNRIGIRTTERAWRIGTWSLAAGLLSLPLLAMQFTDAVAWGIGDFVAAALLLCGGCVAVEITLRLAHTRTQRLLAVGATALVLLLIWAELAVGILH